VENKHVRLSSAVALLILAGVARGQASNQCEDGSVSVQELLHAPSRKACNAFQAARKLSDQGAHDKAAEQLEKAVELSPYYSDAWINLAAQQLYLSHYELALQDLERAKEIARPTAVLLSDMAYAQFALGRDDEAARSVREALRLDPSYPQAHYILGTFLAHHQRTRAEGIAHLELAARVIPAAREDLERARQGRL
jgi:tetratricopeptide (TPR) repeat protein